MWYIDCMGELNEGMPIQDKKLNMLVKEGIFQPISAVHNPFYDSKLAFLNPYLTYSNPHYDFKNGLPPQLPYMFALGEKKRHPDSLVYCRPKNNRTGILSSDSGILLNGIPLDYLDEKGLGQLYGDSAENSPVRSEYVYSSETQAGNLHRKPITWGVTDLEWALHDAKSSDDLINDGLRVVPTVAIVRIFKLIDKNGQYISTDDAIIKGLLVNNSIPAIQFRAFVTPYRPKEFIYTIDHNLSEKELQRRRIMFLEAIDDMSKDSSIPVDFTKKEKSIPTYLDWFAGTFGRSVARLHNARKVHNWLHELHNTTLDVRIIDSDGLETNVTELDIEQEKGTLFSHYIKSPGELWKYYDSIRNLFHLSVTPDYLLYRTVQAYENERVN
jgi:hypothetical protein